MPLCRAHQWTASRVKGKLRLESSFQSALPSLLGFYARLRDDPPPYVRFTVASCCSAAKANGIAICWQGVLCVWAIEHGRVGDFAMR
jgi:hypothetical protein